MRWPAFACVAILGIVFQTTMARPAEMFGVRPEWLAILMVFFALYSVRRDAVLAGWLLGLGADMTSIERVGLTSVAFAVTALAVNALRNVVFLKNVLTHFLVTLVGVGLLHSGLYVYRWKFLAHALGPWAWIRDVGLTSVYAAAWAVPIDWVLLKCSRGLGLYTTRYRHG